MARKIAVFVATAGLVMGAVAGCSSGGSNGADSSEPLTVETAAGAWQLEGGTGPEGEVKPEADNPIELVIEPDGAFSGSSGCNSIFGQMEIAGGVVGIGEIGQTMMFCEGPAMDIEFAYTQALDAVNGGSSTGDKLILTGEDTELRYKSAK